MTRDRENPEAGAEIYPIWIYTPSRTDPKDLEFILVQRRHLLEDAVERVRESALTDHKHHLLFVGPRGCGKTHLVTLIVSRLSDDRTLANRLRIAWLNEDEKCTTVPELFVKIHSALVKRYPLEFRDDTIRPAFDLKPEEALEFVSSSLLTILGDRTLVIVVENLDDIFEGLGGAGQKQLRALIQENPRFSIVATAQRLVNDLSKRTSPFYGFFQTEHLKPLDVKEATELLQKIARLQGDNAVVEFLSTSRGRSRIRALHHLSGGNHRIYIVLSQFITRNNIDTLLGPFMKMVDELTPYYQERIRSLPALQRKIIEYLSGCERTVPVNEIAKRLFSTSQTISRQLKYLRETGYVESRKRGSESLYEISEPLMRICVEVKDTQRRQPLRLLVDFLRVWYENKELKNRLDTMDPFSGAFSYVESALRRNIADGNLRSRILLEDFRLFLSDKLRFDDDVHFEATENEILRLAYLSDGKPGMKITSGEIKAEFLDYIEETTDEDITAADRAALILLKAKLLSDEGGVVNAIEYYTKVIETPGVPAELLSRALINRGNAFGKTGERQSAIDDFTAVIELPEAPAEYIARAHLYRGTIFYKEGMKHESRMDFEANLRLENAPVDIVIDSYLLLAELHFSEARWGEGFLSLEEGLEYRAENQPMYHVSETELLRLVFDAGLSSDARIDTVAELSRIYHKYKSLSELGEALVEHLGDIYRAREPFPSADNLEGWAFAWEQAAKDIDDFNLSMKLLRTGVDFIKAGGIDSKILLDLPSTERRILEQSLGLHEEND